MVIRIVSIYLFVAILVTAYIAAYIGSRGKANYLKMLALSSTTVGLLIFGYLMEINSTTIEQMFFWNQIQYLVLPFISLIWLIVGLMYTGRFKSFFSWKMLILYSIPVITFILRITNETHHLYYTNYEIVNINDIPLLFLGKGIWYYVQSTFNFLVMFINLLIYYLEYRKNETFTRIKLMSFLVASIIPFIGVALILLNVLGKGIDYTTLLFPVSAFIIIFAIIKYDFLEVKSVTRDAIFEDSKDAMILLNNSNRIIDYNNAAKEFFALIDLSLKYNLVTELVENNNELGEMLLSQKTEIWNVEKVNRYFEIESKVIKSKYGATYGALKTIRNISERKILEQTLVLQATTDELSGLYNRREFLKTGEKLVKQAKRNNLPLAVLMMDLDRFKDVNDNYGHSVGDEVIREFSDLMVETFRQTDITCRMGGEEFAVILLYCDEENAFKKAEIFRKRIEEKNFANGKIKITVSIGLAILKDESKSIKGILKQADIALYKSKNFGRNTTKISEENY